MQQLLTFGIIISYVCIFVCINICAQNTKQEIISHYLFFFFFGHTAEHAELPQPEIEPKPSIVEAWNFNHWTAREVLSLF